MLLFVKLWKKPKSRCADSETLKLALKWTLSSDIQNHKSQLIKTEINFFTQFKLLSTVWIKFSICIIVFVEQIYES